MPSPPPHPFTDSDIRDLEVVVGKIQQAADSEGRLLVLDPTQARLLRKLLNHLRHRSTSCPTCAPPAG